MKTIFFALLFSAVAFAGYSPLSGGNATKLQGTPVGAGSPSDNQCLVYTVAGGDWAPGSCSSGTGIAGTWVTTGNLVLTDGVNTASDSGFAATILTTNTLGNSLAMVTDSSGNINTAALTTAAEIGYVHGVTSAIQTQLGTKAPSTAPSFATSATFSYGTASTTPYFDAGKNLVSSSVTPTELGYVHNVTSAIQTQLNAKLASTNPAVTGYVDTNQISTPSDPASGHDRLYFKSDDNLYALNSSGTEYQVNGGGGGTPGGSTTNIQYNNAGAFGGFGAWDGTNFSFGSMYLNGDGSIGSGSLQAVIGTGAVGHTESIAIGTYATAGEYCATFGHHSTCSADSWSTVVGNYTDDTGCLNGFSMGTYNENISAGDRFACILPGASANMPRMKLPTSVTDDGVSALQVGGSGIMRLVPQANGVTPTCNSGMSGALSETSAWVLCVCNGSAWKSVAVLATTCTF